MLGMRSETMGQLGLLRTEHEPPGKSTIMRIWSYFHSMSLMSFTVKFLSRRGATEDDARSYIPFYNQKRLHSSLGTDHQSNMRR